MENVSKQPAEFNINLLDIYNAVWKHLPFPAAKRLQEAYNKAEFTQSKAEGIGYEGVPLSMLGTPQFFEITIGGLKLPNTPLITISGAKDIVKTKIAGGNFSVKEIISLDDYKINIKGVATNAPGQRAISGTVPSDYPEDWVRKLREMYERNEALEVSCQLLSYFNINQLVVEGIDFPAVPGAQGFVPYEINAISDAPVELELKSKAGEVR
ncbi:DUF6046 domain-containing protein [Rufibacter quisquiliarum]|uniref:DUF6046 domain-containing protein n=1 Tax=Rufibacter quisquiliarum TaxID=1549639 RepID=A0A839GVP3_9BACT|nr:DUF6046 domain-containing protein [Rufibacter quisquiliarum]MBA9078937.1 hypothetical protein [Rufibacter quisquiliarum]